MTNEQFYLAIGVPAAINAVLLALLMAYISSKIEALRADMNQRFEGVNQRFEAVNQRFDDMRDLWRSELKRVEEVIDARLRHLEDRTR